MPEIAAGVGEGAAFEESTMEPEMDRNLSQHQFEGVQAPHHLGLDKTEPFRVLNATMRRQY